MSWLTASLSDLPAFVVAAYATILGGLIAFVSAWVVARVNARAAHRLAAENAHREYRRKATQPVVAFARRISGLAFDFNQHLELYGTDHEIKRARAIEAMARLRQGLEDALRRLLPRQRNTSDAIDQSIEVVLLLGKCLEESDSFVEIVNGQPILWRAAAGPFDGTKKAASVGLLLNHVAESIDLACEAHVYQTADVSRLLRYAMHQIGTLLKRSGMDSTELLYLDDQLTSLDERFKVFLRVAWYSSRLRQALRRAVVRLKD